MGRQPVETNIVTLAVEPFLPTLPTARVLFVTLDLAGSTRPASGKCLVMPPGPVRRGRRAGGHGSPLGVAGDGV